jgi:Zn-dependent alcohol dehydrogenase
MIAMMMLRKGGACVVTGMAKLSDMMIPLVLPDMVSSCKTLKGALYGEMNPCDAIPKLLSMYEAGTIKLDELVTQKYKLDDINEARRDLRAGNNIRGVIALEQHRTAQRARRR